MDLRLERDADHDAVRHLQTTAFGDHGPVVADLVDDLRRSITQESGLSLVAEVDGEVAGHVMLTRSLLDAPRRLVDVEVLSPLGVAPALQRQGIGSALVRRALEIAADRGVPVVFLEGDPRYYGRFGFRPGSELGFLKPSVRIPDAGFQAVLLPAHEPWMTGALVYSETFWRHDCVGLREASPDV